MTLKVKGYTDPRMQAWRDLKLIVKPSVESPTLTEEQLELIKGYKEKYGLDLNQFIGVLKCHVEIRYPEGDIGTFYDEETRSFEGKSVITLSDNATAERPILKMIDNPMGLTSFLWEILQKETIEEESWAANEWNQCMLTAIGFERDKEEFEVTLDNLELLLEERSISFLGTVLDNYDEPITSVPFEYSFTAWNRWKQKADNGEKVAVPDGEGDGGNPIYTEYNVSDLIEMGTTLEPRVYLVTSTVDEDAWENEPSDFIESKGSFNEDTFTFQFSWDHYNSGGYTQIYVTYTLNK